MNLIGINIYDPSNAVFGNKSKDRERVTRYYCNQMGCPLLALGKCLNAGMFTKCKYGKAIVETGYTRRAGKYDGKPAKISVTVDDSDKFKLFNRDDLAKIRRLVS